MEEKIYRLYFGHPINTYGTELEKRLLERIDAFVRHILVSHDHSKWVIENPNQAKHAEGYRNWTETQRKMDYFFYEVLPDCHAGIFLPFRDGKWGAGVFGEAEWLFNHHSMIWEINYKEQIQKIDSLGSIPVLSIEETGTRIRDAEKNTLPY